VTPQVIRFCSHRQSTRQRNTVAPYCAGWRQWRRWTSGRSALGPEWGYAQAGSDLAAWWGVNPDQAGQVTEVVPDRPRRSLRVVVRGAMRTLFGGLAELGAGSFQRWEDFYPGPPAEYE